jgi:superfamily I DNA/RNA helicase
LNRILALADRENPVQPAGQPGFTSIIPLPEIISEFLGVGPKTKKVRSFYYKLIQKFGSELDILLKIPEEDLKRVSQPLALGIARMRNNEVLREPGFDGQYGKISVFSARERQEFKSGPLFVTLSLSEEKFPEAAKAREKKGFQDYNQEEKKETSAEIVFNDEQLKAIAAGPGPVLVLAGPGTGKTQTLMGRVNRLLNEGVSPRHILILTFTRKAAKEIQERLVSLRGKNVALPRAETLHALAFEHWHQVHQVEPLILEEVEAKRLFSQANPELKGAELKKAWLEYNLAREKKKDASVFGQSYMRLKQDLNVVDYADLLEFWLEAIERGSYARPFTQVLVDEIQDLSPLQLAIIVKLAGQAGEGFFGIGDPRQSIYGFRGAVSDVEKQLKNIWPELQLITLCQNYRSTQEILDFSAKLFSDPPSLTAQQRKQENGGQIFVFQAPTASAEANWIGDKIKNLIGGTAHWQQDNSKSQQALSPGDIAILVRFKALIPSLTAALKRLGIPYCVPEQEVFYKEPRVEMILRAVSRVLGITDDKDVFDCPEKIVAQGPKGMAAYLKDLPPFDPIFWQSRSFRELSQAYEEHNGWTGLLNHIRLESELDAVRLRAQKVKVMTMHAAKGLEFEAVFLPCLEDGIMPFIGLNLLLGETKGLDEKIDEQEERRLLYVACTRARRFLFLSLAGSRQVFGKTLRLKSSRFLNEFPEEMVIRTIAKAHKQKREKRRYLF